LRGPVELDRQDLADRRGRAVGHHHDAVRQQHRLVDVVRDHHDRAVGASDDLQQLVLQVGACQRIERAERLVEQQHLGLHRQRRAIPTRCFMPPEISCGRLCIAWPMPTSSSAAWCGT
jgi:hypothetical protein